MGTTSLAVVKFVDADVDAVARAVAAILGRPILVDPRVKGKMTLVSDEGLTRPQVYQYFASTLRGLGYAVVESAGLLKIVPEGDAKVQSGTVVAGTEPRGQDQIVTRIFQLQYENASNLVAVLRPLITANNTINVNAGNNSLVITDYADNQTRLAAIIAALDTPSATDVEVIPLKHMQAATVAQIVSRMVDGVQRAQGGSAGTAAGGNASAGNMGNGGSTGTSSGSAQVYADITSNALLVRAPSQARLQAIRALVSRLDKPGNNGIAGSSIHVIYLKHAEATRLASVLRAAFSAQDTNNGLNATESGGGTSSSGRSSGATTAFASVSGGSSSGSAGSGSDSSTSSKQATAPVSATAEPSTGGFIQADPATNALIVTASEPRFRELAAVVDLLDSNRAQVYVESLIVEVDASKALDVGIQWKQIFNISTTTTDITLGTVVNALESMSGTNILSTANLVTLDNEEAKIVVGQNVPFVTGSYTTTSASSSPFQTIERKDVGITLRIRPQIGPNGSIRLTIYQESSSVSSTTTPGTTNAGPTTNKRSVESTVTVKDGKIIVLGGLIEDSDTADADHLYGLGKLPLVGGLFSSRSHTRKKTNLLVFLRPVIMLDDDAAERLTLDRYDLIRARQQALPANVREMLQDASPPALAPTKDAAATSQP
ncbi:secretin N-terminal domain-containing protein [Roseateles terrae]|uniref:General secretion pathway protein D n=1 Tax=Roseateles terrae TaxID=431060 RepID=A0ABR6GLN3_9BURK|nr:secretin N-terminal domain-containing protein [Roseateles terrae]MBB3193025.1 general secretion pathway protein D [Roseateles terrae]